jgi:hypothetical protein
MTDRAHGAQQDTHQHDEDGIELLAPVDATLHDGATPAGQHGDKHGPAAAGGVLHGVFNNLRQLLGSSKTPEHVGSFSPLSSEDTDAHPSQGAAALVTPAALC